MAHVEGNGMETSQRLYWLRRVLLIKVVLTFLAWGLPALTAPPAFLAPFGIAMPEDPTFLRLFGAVVTAVGVAYWYAYQDPVRNVAILKFGIADNGLNTLTIIVLGFTVGISSWFIWVSGILTAFFCIAFVVLMPRE
jgi:hypothetical protein